MGYISITIANAHGAERTAAMDSAKKHAYANVVVIGIPD
jgi:hypothetical protein